MTRWQKFLWRLGFTGYGHPSNALELLEQRQLATVRATHARTRKERDGALKLLRAIRITGGVPRELEPLVNSWTALDSEGDIEDARNEALRLLAGLGWEPARD